MSPPQLLVHLVTTNPREVVALRCAEQRLDQRTCRLDRRELTRTQFAIQIEKRLVPRGSRVLLDRVAHELGVAEQRDDLFVRLCDPRAL